MLVVLIVVLMVMMSHFLDSPFAPVVSISESEPVA